MEFKTTNNLNFEGCWKCEGASYKILAVINNSPGNGHLTDVLEWFERSCRRDKKSLMICEFFLNKGFKKHLIEKRGFENYGVDDVIKKFK